MRKTVGVIFMCAFLSLLAAAEAAVPGKTVADEVLQKDIAKMIGDVQTAMAPQCDHEIIDTRVKTVFELPSGLLTVMEEWVVKSCGKEIVYPVELKESEGGGVDFTVTSPSIAFFKDLENEE